MLKQMIALTALMVSSIAFAQDREYVIVVHGGADWRKIRLSRLNITPHWTLL